MRRRIRRAAALTVAVFVASGQVGASLYEGNAARGSGGGGGRGAILLCVILPPSFPFLSFFFLVPSVLWDRWNGVKLRLVDSEPRMREEMKEIRAGPNVLFCCSVTRWLNIFSFSFSFSSISQASRASSELDEAYASVHSWIDEVSRTVDTQLKKER